jgi:hypothetical protein
MSFHSRTNPAGKTSMKASVLRILIEAYEKQAGEDETVSGASVALGD